MWPPPDPGDIVWCRFPQGVVPDPGPKSRPALVIAVDHRTSLDFVVAAYGTSQKLDRIYKGEFALLHQVNLAAFNATGLAYSTKFDLNRLFVMPWGRDYFAVPPSMAARQNPKLGVLQGDAMLRFLEAARQISLGEKVENLLIAQNLLPSLPKIVGKPKPQK